MPNIHILTPKHRLDLLYCRLDILANANVDLAQIHVTPMMMKKKKQKQKNVLLNVPMHCNIEYI